MPLCHECGSPRDADSQFCPWCFALPGPEQQAPVVVAEPVTVPAAPSVPSVSPPAPDLAPTPTPPTWTTTPVAPPTRTFESPATAHATAPTTTNPGYDLFSVRTPTSSRRSPVLLVIAVLFVVVATAAAGFVLTRDEDEAPVNVAGATLPMTTDEQIRAAFADVAAAQRAHFASAHTFTTSPRDLRAAGSKAPLADGPGADKPGLVFVDVEPGPSKVKNAFYLSARTASGGCNYFKGEHESTYEASDPACEISVAVDYGAPMEQRKLEAAVLRLEDLGPGWNVGESTEGTLVGWDPVVATCLGITPAVPVHATTSSNFVRGNGDLEVGVGTWSTAALANQDLTVVDQANFGSCYAEELKRYVSGETRPGLRDFTVTLESRGDITGIPNAKRARWRIIVRGNGGEVSVWIDLLVAVRDRREVTVMATELYRPPNAAVAEGALRTVLGRLG